MEIITRTRYAVEKIGLIKNFDEGKDIDNQKLIDEILAQGDRIGNASNVKAPMTEWNMCYHSEEFQKLSKYIIREGALPYLEQYYSNKEDVHKYEFFMADIWGAEYRGNNEDYTQPHDHRYSKVSFSYYLQTPEGCPPIIFDDMRAEIHPEPGLLVLFRGDYLHSVPPAAHKGSRIMIAGNINVLPNKDVCAEYLKRKGYEVNEPVSDS